MSQDDLPATFTPVGLDDVEHRDLMIPMRDGVSLHTIVLVPHGHGRRPLMLDRSPYGATKYTRMTPIPQVDMATIALHSDLLKAGYLVAMQDVRGKHGSEGTYVLNRPLGTDGVDHSTDAWDTIAWLVDNVPECDGSVGTLGISYDGFTALMSLVDPHPALRASVPINPMVDGWNGDDWFHNGAFRQTEAARYLYQQTGTRASEHLYREPRYDEYETYLRAGSAASLGTTMGLDVLPAWIRMLEHPDYDDYWQGQAMDRILAAKPLTVPTLMVHSQWDSEDIHGIMSVWASIGPASLTSLVIGPWSHTGGSFERGDRLGGVRFGSDTGIYFRRELLIPFLDKHLRGTGPGIARVNAFETGSNSWHTGETWPPAAASSKALHLGSGFGLSFVAPGDPGLSDDYASDPAKPVTYQPRPIRTRGKNATWDQWLVDDQRFAGDRTDVLVYTSTVLTEPIRLAGQPVVHLDASTSGTDSDWVVKLIDVYPDNVSLDELMGGYQLPLSMDVLRGRYRADPSRPKALPPNEVVSYTLFLPHISHVVLPGHRLMLQVQSSWFPLYDRNPQTFVPSIMTAEPQDYVRATQRVFHSTWVDLPVLP